MEKFQKDKVRILIADDHAVVRQGLKQIISKTSDLVIVGEAENGNEVLERIPKVNVDVVVMDVEMPGKSGWDVLSQLKFTHPKLPVLILSIYSEEHFGLRFLKAGASGYLTKASAPAQLIEAIRKVSKGGKFVSPNLAEQMVYELKKDSSKPLHETLSVREFQIFFLIASGKKIKTIAKELSVSPTTISTHKTRILEKMNLKSNAELVHYAVKNGLIS